MYKTSSVPNIDSLKLSQVGWKVSVNFHLWGFRLGLWFRSPRNSRRLVSKATPALSWLFASARCRQPIPRSQIFYSRFSSRTSLFIGVSLTTSWISVCLLGMLMPSTPSLSKYEYATQVLIQTLVISSRVLHRSSNGTTSMCLQSSSDNPKCSSTSQGHTTVHMCTGFQGWQRWVRSSGTCLQRL